MRKKELLEMKKLTVTKTIMGKVVNDIATKGQPPRYTRYYRAVVSGGILKVAIWTRKQLIRNQTIPAVEIYIDKENDTWINYNPKENTWGKAKIENLLIGCQGEYENDWYGVRGYESDECRKLVNQYLEKEKNGPNLLVRDAIKKWQKSITDTIRMRRYQRELEHIDSVMNLAPELPKDFEKWAQTEAYYHAQYMIYDRPAKKARCTNCWSVVDAKKTYKHNETVRCPVCKLEVTCKSWNKQKTILDRKHVGIIQRLRDGSGYILRRFETQMRYSKDKDYSKEWWMYETTRFLLSPTFVKTENFEWGEYKNTGIRRWCHELNHGGYEYYNYLSTECILYHRNITRMIADTDIKYIPVAQILKKKPGTYCDADKIMRNAKYNPQIEMLHKVGLNKLAAEYLSGKIYDKKKWNKENPWNYLGISKEYLQLAIKMDAGERFIKVMRKATELNVKIDAEQVRFYSKYFGNNPERIFALGHTEKMYKYLQQIRGIGERALGDYLDYIEDLRKLGIPYTKQALFPKNFEEEHREVAEIRREHENKLEAMKLKEKNNEFRKMLPKIRTMFECENEDFVVVVPNCKKDFQDEGREQHNCVGGSYFDKMLRGDCVVVFLRRKAEPEKSFCTVEFAPDGSVRQNRAIYNHEAPNDAQAFINAMSKKLKRTIEKEKAKAVKEAEEKAETPFLAYAT